ncbi:MAG: (deoxy)nucleoside triphosphate pyrophosphohydrolase [Bacteroidales bacterium]|nr:(deoxy)nucleoside triphosphate pyrophosphohydrolase [Bacteroidales bacterium]
MKKIEVVAAIILHEGKILCVKRGRSPYEYLSFKYEFPGGKVEKGEGYEEALIREIREELKLEIDIKGHFMTVNHLYPHFEITLHSYLCSSKEDSIEIALTEHVEYKWLYGKDIFSVEWAAADVSICESLLITSNTNRLTS